jgi:hypothetical protein
VEGILLSNEFGGKFPAFGEWLKAESVKSPLGLYDKPPSAVDEATTQAITISREDVLALRPNTLAEQGDVPLHASVPTCKEQGTEVVRNCATEVSSFARLLAHSLSGECRNNQDCPPHTTKEDSIRYATSFSANLGSSPIGPKSIHVTNSPSSPTHCPLTDPACEINPSPDLSEAHSPPSF